MKDIAIFQIIRIPIVNDMVFERDEMFEVILSDATGGAKIGSINRTAVTITNDDGKYIFSHPLPSFD